MKTLVQKALFLTCASYFPLFCLAQSVNFSVDQASGCVPLTVKFTNTSIAQNITALEWSFGNGNSSILENPSATYTVPGSYKVILTAKNGTSTMGTKELVITVHDKPQFDFTFSEDAGCSPLSVSFVTEEENKLVSYDWIFGDGSTSTSNGPTYVYGAGTYSVALIGTSEFGCSNTVFKNSIIEVYGIDGTVSASDTVLCQIPSSVAFAATAFGTGSQFEYAWDFGDGESGGGASPTHTFKTSGVYTVSMTATDEKGCSMSRSIKIYAGAQEGIDFNMSAPESCVGDEVAFAAFSTQEVVSLYWDFGNGETSNSPEATATYAEAGTYQVVLTAQLAGLPCESTLIKIVEIREKPTSDFTHVVNCGLEVAFENTSDSNSSYSWDFGDGSSSSEQTPLHTYSTPGTYLISLTTKNSTGCEVVGSRQVQVSHLIETAILPNELQACDAPSLSGCAPFNISFSSETTAAEDYTLLWNFGDNSGATDAGPNHTYTDAGTYNVVLKATTASGCSFEQYATVRVSATTPTAAFSPSRTELCVGEPIQFLNESKDADFFCWDFGDSTSTTGPTVSHAYSQPGQYTITLVAKNAGCADRMTKTNLILVKGPSADFEFNTTCDNPYLVSFQNLSADYDSLFWDFGDGEHSSKRHPSHEYAEKGEYTISLSASNLASGCNVTASKTINIYRPVARFEATDSVACKGTGIQFQNLSEDAAEWFWSFGDGSVSSVENPLKSYNNAGLFSIALSITAPDGCKATLVNTDMIKVLDIAGDFQFTTKNLCDTLVVNFEDLSTGFPGIERWQWDFGDGTKSGLQQPVHYYTGEGAYDINLTLFNEEGNCVVTKNNQLVFNKPHAAFSTDANVYCLGQSFVIQNNSTNASEYEWDFGNGIRSELSNPSPSFSAAGTYKVMLTAKDADGCISETPATKTIKVVQPEARFTAVNNFTECPPLITTFMNESESDIISYHWDFGDGQSSTQAQPLVTYSVPGTYSVTLRVVDKDGCTSTLAQNNIIYVGGPYGSLDFGSHESCVFDGFLFEAKSENTVLYRWDFGDGNVVETAFDQVEHAYQESGDYFIGLVFINSRGCEVPYQENPKIIVHPLPTADFSAKQPYPFTGEPLEVISTTGEDNLSYHWFYEDETDEGDSITLEFTEPGEQEIMMIFESDAGCQDTVRHELYVQQAILDLPNAFSPNNDPFNDLLVLPGVEKGRWTLQLFSRTGQKVLEKNSYANDWNGGDLPSGVYYYLLSNELRPEKTFKGYIHLIK